MKVEGSEFFGGVAFPVAEEPVREDLVHHLALEAPGGGVALGVNGELPLGAVLVSNHDVPEVFFIQVHYPVFHFHMEIIEV